MLLIDCRNQEAAGRIKPSPRCIIAARMLLLFHLSPVVNLRSDRRPREPPASPHVVAVAAGRNGKLKREREEEEKGSWAAVVCYGNDKAAGQRRALGPEREISGGVRRKK